MILFETLLQGARYAARTLLRNAGFATGAVFAVASDIGVNTAAFTTYTAFVARPLDARDPSTLLDFAIRLHSRANARFRYPDYESYRDHLHSFTGVIAFSIDQLSLPAGASANWRRAEAGSCLGRLELPSATAQGSS